MINLLIDSVIVAIAGVVWVLMLVAPGDILDWVQAFFYNHVSKNPRLMKVLFQCEKCAAGQLALWGYPVSVKAFTAHSGYNVFNHVMVVLLSIFMARVIGGVIQKYL